MGDYKLHVVEEGVGMGEIQFKIYYKKKSTCSFCHVVNFVTANHQPTEIEEPRALLRLFLHCPSLVYPAPLLSGSVDVQRHYKPVMVGHDHSRASRSAETATETLKAFRVFLLGTVN